MTDIDPQKNVLCRVESETGTPGALEFLQTKIPPIRSHLSRVRKEYHLESDESFESVFKIGQHQLPVPEAILVVSSNTLMTADMWEKVERNSAPVCPFHILGTKPQSKHPVLVE